MTGIMQMLLGSAAAFKIVNPLTGGDANSVQPTPSDAYAGWRFNPDGTIDKMVLQTSATFNVTNNQQWFNPTGTAPATYYIRATLQTGTGPTYGRSSSNPTSNPGMGVWLALTSARSWYSGVTSNLGDGRYNKFTIDIASDSGGSNIVASGTFTIEVEIDMT